jgi:hypothetical protein
LYDNLWKELIRLPSVEGQPTKSVLSQTRIGVFFIRYASDTTFAMLFLLKPPASRRGPQFEKHYAKTKCSDKLSDQNKE